MNDADLPSQRESDSDVANVVKDAPADRWDRRFRIRGEVVDALRAVVSESSSEK